MADSGFPTLPPVAETAAGADINTPVGAKELLVVCKSDAFVEFYDAKSLARIDEIKLPDFPHEVVLSPDRKTAYVSIYGNGQVGTNTRPGTRIAVIDLAQPQARGLHRDRALSRAARHDVRPRGASLGDGGASAIRSSSSIPRAARCWARSQLGSHRTHFLAVTPDGAKVYAPHRQLKLVSVVDVATRKEVKRIQNFSYECQGVAVAPDGNRVYQASSARPLVSVIDPKSDEVAGARDGRGHGRFPAAADAAQGQPGQSLARRLVQRVAQGGRARHARPAPPVPLRSRARADGDRVLAAGPGAGDEPRRRLDRHPRSRRR